MKPFEMFKEKLNSKTFSQSQLNSHLLEASLNEDANSIQLLIDKGANPNNIDEFGCTMLHWAVKGDKEPNIIQLLKNNANFDEFSLDGMNFIQVCLKMGYTDVLEWLRNNYNSELFQYRDEFECNALHLACHFGVEKSVKYLLDLNTIGIEEKDENGLTLLHHVCNSSNSKEFPSILQLLIDKGIYILALTKNKKTCLDLAYEAGKSQELIEILSRDQIVHLLIVMDRVIQESSLDNEIFEPDNNFNDTYPVENNSKSLKTPMNNIFQFQSSSSDNNLAVGSSQTQTIWRKILLNDDTDLLENYRDSRQWFCDENPMDFESSQKLTEKQLCQIFMDSYENGVGIYSYFKNEFRNEINKGNLREILMAVTGLKEFQSIKTENCVVFDGLHNSILFIAFIAGRFKVAKILLKMRQFDLIPVSLLLGLIVTNLSGKNQFPDQIEDNLKLISNKAELIAVDALNREYCIDNSPGKYVTLTFLNTPLVTYGGLSVLDLADLGNCSNFLSLPCCQRTLDKRWYGSFPQMSLLTKWINRFIPISVFFFNPFPRNISENPDCSHTIKKHQLFYKIINAPNTKFFYHSLAHIIFLAIFSHIMLWDFYKEIKFEECLCYSFVLGYCIEEFYQIQRKFNQNVFISYLKDKWNWLDLLAILSAFIGFSIRIYEHYYETISDFYYQSVDSHLYIARLFLLICLLCFYFRLLFILTLSENLGPKLRMIFEMFSKDFLPMLLLFFIFIFSFGILFQSILYPNGWKFKNNHSLPSIQFSDSKMFSLLLLIDRTSYSIFELDYASNEMNCETQDYCSHELGRILFLNVFLTLYILIVNILLMNLMIALFSDTVSRILERSLEHWLAGRYKLIEEYQERSICPPPFNIIERFIRMLVTILLREKNVRQIFKQKTNRQLKQLTNLIKYLVFQAFALKDNRYKLGLKSNGSIINYNDSNNIFQYHISMYNDVK